MKNSEWLIVLVVVSVIMFALAATVCGQDTLRVSEANTVIPLGGNRYRLVSQPGQNYYDSTARQFKKRDVRFLDSPLNNKVEYRQGHNVVLDTVSGAVNLNKDGKYIVFRPVNPDLPDVARARARVNHHALWKDVNYDVQLLPNGDVETFIELLNSGAQTSFTFAAEFSKQPIVTAGGVIADGYISAPIAHDANGSDVPVTWELTGPTAGVYTYSMSIDPAGFEFPIVIDPTISINSSIQGYATGDDATYSTARDEDPATGTTATTFFWAGNRIAGTYKIERALAAFSLAGLPPTYSDSITTVTGAGLVLDATANTAIGSRSVLIASGQWTGGVTADDYPDFVGRATGGPHTGIKNLFGSFRRTGFTGFADSAWSTYEYTANGVDTLIAFSYTADTLVAHAGDTLRITGIYSLDSSNTTPSSSEELVAWDVSPAPILYIDFTRTFVSTYDPYDIVTTGSGVGELRVMFSDSNVTAKSVKLLRASDLAVMDSSRYSVSVTDTLHWTGLVPGNSYNFYLSTVRDSDGDSSMVSGSGTAGSIGSGGGGTGSPGIQRRVGEGVIQGRVNP